MPSFTKTLTSIMTGLFRNDPDADPDEYVDNGEYKEDVADSDLAEAAATSVEDEDSGLWWEDCEVTPPKFTVIQGMDGDGISNELQESINRGTFRMIDIPSNVFKCIDILNQPDFNFGQVEDLISHSPVLAGNIITIANSSFYNRGIEITKLGVALPRLGSGKIKAILYFASCERQLSNHPLFSQVATHIVNHSFAVAQIADYLSFRYYGDSDNAFLAGLLHDVGKLALLKEMASNYAMTASPESDLTEDSYGDVLPRLHSRIGHMVAKHWQLNPQIATVIGYHHDLDLLAEEATEDSDIQLVHLIHLADTVARMLGRGRHIGLVDLPSLAEGLDLHIEWDADAVEFFAEVPAILKHKDEQVA